MTQPCKICNGTGTVHCPNQLCAHWCPCTTCDGTGKVEVWEDWSLGFGEEKVRASSEIILIECRICGKGCEKEDMHRFGLYYICEDCDQRYMEKWPRKEKAK